MLRGDAQNGAADCVATLEDDEVIGHTAGLDPLGQRQLEERVQRRQRQYPGRASDDQAQGDDGGDVDVPEDDSDSRQPERPDGQQERRGSGGR